MDCREKGCNPEEGTSPPQRAVMGKGLSCGPSAVDEGVPGSRRNPGRRRPHPLHTVTGDNSNSRLLSTYCRTTTVLNNLLVLYPLLLTPLFEVGSIMTDNKTEAQRGHVICPSDSRTRLKFNFSRVCPRSLLSPCTHWCLSWKDLSISVQRQGGLIKGMIHRTPSRNKKKNL